MSGDILGGILGILPTWAWLTGLVSLGMIAWALGDDGDRHSDQDSIDRLLSGVGSILYGLMKGGGEVARIAVEGFVGLFQLGGAALGRFGKWAEENVSIEIVLDGAFWWLVLVVVLIITGYFTLSALLQF